jgi:tellurite resistance protein TerB
MFEFDYNVGKAEAMNAIVKMKSKRDAGKALIALCCSIGATDGDFGKAEIALVKEMCTVLRVKPKEFNL